MSNELTPIRNQAFSSGPATADLSGAAHLFAKRDSNNLIDICGDGEPACGVFGRSTEVADFSALSSEGRVNVHVGEQALIYSGAAFSFGAQLAADANGKAVTAATGKAVNARALEAATGADELILCALVLGSTDAA